MCILYKRELFQFVFSFINLYPLWKRGELKRQPLIVWISFSVPAILYCFNNNVSILVQQYLDPASYVVHNLLTVPSTVNDLRSARGVYCILAIPVCAINTQRLIERSAVKKLRQNYGLICRF